MDSGGKACEGFDVAHQAEKLAIEDLKRRSAARFNIPDPPTKARGATFRRPPRKRRASYLQARRAALLGATARAQLLGCAALWLLPAAGGWSARCCRANRLAEITTHHHALGAHAHRPWSGTRPSASLVPIVSDDARTFRHGGHVSQVVIYSSVGHAHTPAESGAALCRPQLFLSLAGLQTSIPASSSVGESEY